MIEQREIVRQHTNPRPGYDATDGRLNEPYGAKSSKSGVIIAAIAAVVVILALLLVFAGGDNDTVVPAGEPLVQEAPVVAPDAAPLNGDAVAPTEVPSNPAEAPEAGAPATEGVPEETAPAANQ